MTGIVLKAPLNYNQPTIWHNSTPFSPKPALSAVVREGILPPFVRFPHDMSTTSAATAEGPRDALSVVIVST